MSTEYSVQIIWSNEDGAYISFPAELPGCIADGQTPEESLANLRVVMAEWLETARLEGRVVPPPMSIEDFAREHQKANAAFQQQVQTRIQQEVENAVKQFFANFIVEQQPVSSSYFHKRVALTQTDELEVGGGHRR